MTLPRHVRFGVLERCNFSCFYCGLPAAGGVVTLQIDHVIPRSIGGTDAPWNLVAACQPCNIGKSDIMPDSSLIQAAADLYLAWPGRSRVAGACGECGRLYILRADEMEAGGDLLCAHCQLAWCSGYDTGTSRGV